MDPREMTIIAGSAMKKAERLHEFPPRYEKMHQERLQLNESDVGIYIKNLAKHIDDDLLWNAFDVFGNITSAKVILNKENNTSKGFGFVFFSAPEEARRAIFEMNGKIVDGRQLYVAPYQKKEDRGANLCSQFHQRVHQPQPAVFNQCAKGPFMARPENIPRKHPWPPNMPMNNIAGMPASILQDNSEICQLKDTIKRLKAEQAVKDDENEDLQMHLKNSEKKAKRELKQTEVLLEEKDEIIADFERKMRISDNKSMKIISEKDTEIEKLNREIAILKIFKTQVKDLEETKAKMELASANTKKMLENKIAKITQSNNMNGMKIMLLEEKVEEKQKFVKKLENELVQLKEKLKNLETAIKDKDTELGRKQNDLDVLKDRLTKCTQSSTYSERRLVEKACKLDDCKRNLMTEKENNDKLNNSIRDQAKKLQHNEAKIKQLEMDIQPHKPNKYMPPIGMTRKGTTPPVGNCYIRHHAEN